MNGTRAHHEIRSRTLCGIGNIFSKKFSMKVLVCYVCVVARAKNLFESKRNLERNLEMTLTHISS